MAKSKRSKVKMAYKAMRRAVMEPKHDAALREQAAKVYKAIGLPLPDERVEAERMRARSHGGGELVSTFVPTPDGPSLNVVHGPLALNTEALRLPKDVVGFPVVGAGARARMRAERPVRQKRESMDIDDGAFQGAEEKPYFYPRRARKSGGIRKGKRKEKAATVVRKTERKVAPVA